MEAESGHNAGERRDYENKQFDFQREKRAAGIFGVPREHKSPQHKSAKKNRGFGVPKGGRTIFPKPHARQGKHRAESRGNGG